MQGIFLRLKFSHELARRVLANNSKAALFGTLDSLAKLPGCCALYWSFENRDRRCVVIVFASKKTTTGRTALPIDRLIPFLAAPPRTYETVFALGFSSLEKTAEITIDLARSSTSQKDHPTTKEQYLAPECTDGKIESKVDDEEWIELQGNNVWVAVLRPRAKLPLPRSQPCSPSGSVTLSIVPQKYPVPAAILYSACRVEAKALEKKRRVTSILSELESQQLDDDENDWVLVT